MTFLILPQVALSWAVKGFQISVVLPSVNFPSFVDHLDFLLVTLPPLLSTESYWWVCHLGDITQD